MTEDAILKLAKQWDSNADQYERRNKSINTSACHDGKRQLNVGLAAASRAHAEALRSMIASQSVPESVDHDDQ